MRVGDKVYCNDGYSEFTGWIASINDNTTFPYSVVKEMKYIGKTFYELSDEHDSVFEVYKLEDLTLLQDDPNGFNEKDSIERDKKEETK